MFWCFARRKKLSCCFGHTPVRHPVLHLFRRESGHERFRTGGLQSSVGGWKLGPSVFLAELRRYVAGLGATTLREGLESLALIIRSVLAVYYNTAPHSSDLYPSDSANGEKRHRALLCLCAFFSLIVDKDRETSTRRCTSPKQNMTPPKSGEKTELALHADLTARR